jgi:diguanylate cyclase
VVLKRALERPEDVDVANLPSAAVRRAAPLLRLSAALLPAAAAAVTAALGVAGSRWAFPVGALLSGLLAMAGGGAVLGRFLRQRRPFQFGMGSAALVWGLGQAMIGAVALAAPGAGQRPTLGDTVCTAAAPLAVLGFLAAPRPEGQAGRRRRLGLDALVLAAAAAAVLWQVAFRPVTVDGSSSATLAAVVLLADLSVLALGLELAVAGLDRGVVVSVLGISTFVAADLVTNHELVVPGGTWPWQAAATACLAWPLLCGGFLLIGSGEVGPRAVRALDPDTRTGTTTTVLVVGLAAGLVMSTTAAGQGLDTISAGLLVLLLGLFGAREVLHQRQRRALVSDLRAQAEQDFLTGVGNRRALTGRLAQLSAGGAPSSVVVLDLDGFKEINDRLGHSAGDRLLVAVASGLRAALPQGWEAYRLGGDEFALAGTGDVHVAAAVATVLLDAVRDAAAVEGVGRALLSASAGVALLPPRGQDPLVALSEASTAMQAAKAAGRDRVAVHAGELAARARHHARLTRRLRETVAADRLDAALQPIVDIGTGAVVGFEVLSRWNDEELGPVPPDEFVPVAEETGLVVEVGAAVLRRGLEALAAAGGVERRLRLSVNASPLELRTPGYADGVRTALARAGVPGDLLVVEVTEAVFVTRDDPAVTTLHDLVALGVRIAVDDFGTGYSSLSYLGRLPVHLVKIDRSMTSGLGDLRTRAVVEALVRMCAAMDLEVVAEGVEDAGQAAALTGLGVRLGQGWLWSPAVPAADVPALLARTPREAGAPDRAPAPGPALGPGRPATASGAGRKQAAR